MPDNVRKYTTLFLELADEGVISWKNIAEMALNYMSEDDVEDMFHYNGLDEFDPSEEEEDDENYDYDDPVEEEELGINYDDDDDDFNYEEEFENE